MLQAVRFSEKERVISEIWGMCVNMRAGTKIRMLLLGMSKIWRENSRKGKRYEVKRAEDTRTVYDM